VENENAVARFVARRWSVPDQAHSVQLQPLSGGLESPVALVRVAGGSADVPPLVVKHLGGRMGREADVYELLWKHLPQPPAPRLFGVDSVGDARYLYMEAVGAVSAWPWVETSVTAAVCRSLAHLHDTATLPHDAFAWNYEQELAASAVETLALAVTARGTDGARCWTRVGDLRRVVQALPVMRGLLLASGTAVIHGDVHPGNVIVRNAAATQVVFIDWSRARVGSPFEDIASWLQSLGCWEPQARRRHDSLLRAYLTARRSPLALTADVRTHYWFASASNGLAGAIRYHLAVLGDPASTEQRCYDARRALKAWRRVVRRAAAVLSTSASRCS
jgi:aminoglycoside phosphotransferase (APT) family kinase protein